jgi:hypothetical protein
VEECITERFFRRLVEAEFSGDLETIKYIWAIPGFANYFLSDDLFLSEYVKTMAKDDPEFFVKHSSLAKRLYRSEAELYVASKAFLQGTPLVYLAPSYSAIVYLVLEHTALLHDEREMIITNRRSNPVPKASTALTGAVFRRIMQFWACPLTRLCFASIQDDKVFPKPYSCRSICFFKFLVAAWNSKNIVKEWLRKDELFPGMTAVQFLHTLLGDPGLFDVLPFSGTHQVLYGLFKERVGTDTPFACMGAAERNALMDKFHDWKPDGVYFDPNVLEDGFDLRTLMSMLISGCSTKTLLEMYEAAHESAATPVDPRTTLYLNDIKHQLMADVWPSVAVFARAIEPIFQRGTFETASSLPEDVVQEIAEFALPSKCDVFSRDTIGDSFHEPASFRFGEQSLAPGMAQFMRVLEEVCGGTMD